jgi:hypothetical protein
VQAASDTFVAGAPTPEERALGLAGAMALVTVIAPAHTAGEHWMIKQPRDCLARLTVGSTETLNVYREDVGAHLATGPLHNAGWYAEVGPWPAEMDDEIIFDDDRRFSSLGDDQEYVRLTERAFLWALGNPGFVRAARLASTRLAIRTNLLQRRNYDAELVERATAPFGGLEAAFPSPADDLDDLNAQAAYEQEGSLISYDRPLAS